MRTIPDDILRHLKLGALLALLLSAVAWLAQGWPGLAVSLGSVALGYGVERYQAIRREGTASLRDMAASAAPGLLLGLFIWAAL